MRYRYLLLIVPIIFLSGCYNYKELNELGITTSISVDYSDNNYHVIAEVLNPLKQQDASSGDKSAFVNFEASAPTIQEAFRNIVLESPRQLYGAQLEILVLSEEVINEHLDEALEFFASDPETRTEIKVIIARGDESVKGITIQSLLTEFSSSNILSSLEVEGKILGITNVVTLNDLLNMYMDPYLEVVLPSMILYGNPNLGDEKENLTTSHPLATVKIGTTAVIRDNKILGYLSFEESKVANLINGNVTQTLVHFPYKEGYMVFEPNRVKVKKKVDIRNNIVKIELSGYSKTKEVQANVNIKDVKEVDNLNKHFNEKMENLIINTFDEIRDKYNTDIFGFRELYYKTDYRYFKKYCNNWYKDIFPNIKLEVDSNIRLYEKGNTLGGVDYERKNN